MFIVVVEIEMLFFQSNSLKEKRSIIKSIIDKARRKYNVSIAEVDLMDQLNRGVIGVGQVSNDLKYSKMVLQKVINFIDQEYQVEIIQILWDEY